ncbi:hypothetical protein BKA81DRAFT_366083 [Phyllosticta paracitricarpa]
MHSWLDDVVLDAVVDGCRRRTGDSRRFCSTADRHSRQASASRSQLAERQKGNWIIMFDVVLRTTYQVRGSTVRLSGTRLFPPPVTRPPSVSHPSTYTKSDRHFPWPSPSPSPSPSRTSAIFASNAPKASISWAYRPRPSSQTRRFHGRRPQWPWPRYGAGWPEPISLPTCPPAAVRTCFGSSTSTTRATSIPGTSKSSCSKIFSIACSKNSNSSSSPRWEWLTARAVGFRG